MRVHTAPVARMVAIRAESGEDLLDAITRGVAAAGVTEGVFVSGAGSLATYHFHVVRTTGLPPGNTFIEGVGPFDILNVSGAVAAGHVHAHLTLSTAHVAMGGHLEPGCAVLTFALVVLLETAGADLAGWDTFSPRP